MLALDGQPITPAEFFRGLVGLVSSSTWSHYDWRRISLTFCLHEAAYGGESSPLGVLLGQLDYGRGYLLAETWVDEVGAYRQASRDGLAEWRSRGAPRSLVSMALQLHEVLQVPATEDWASLPAVDHVYRLEGFRAPPPWSGWLLAPWLPELIADAVGGPPLPCLVPLRRSMRFQTQRPIDTVRAFLAELDEQAAAGLMLLDRMEACAAVWRHRVGHATVRSRVDQATALFLALPAMTRHQLAAALGVTPPGAGFILSELEAAGIVRRMALSPRNVFFVADESLGDFKLVPRQGRHLQVAGPPASSLALEDLAAAMKALDEIIAPEGNPREAS